MYLSKNAGRKNYKSVAAAYLFYNWDVLRCTICPVLYKKRDITPKIPERFNHRLNKKTTPIFLHDFIYLTRIQPVAELPHVIS